VTTWTFVRHGESTANAEGWLAGHDGVGLTDRGRAQALKCRAQLALSELSQAYCSDLPRAIETAKILLANRDIPLQEVAALRERDAGLWTRRSIADLDPAKSTLLARWDCGPPQGETLRDVALRALEWITRSNPVGPVLVVSHGALMRSVIGILDGTPRDAIDTWHPVNCQIVVRSVPPQKWQRLLESVLAEIEA
jgi:alpha-ribazole phosphatase